MAPTDRFVTRFAAEPPQDGIPYGRWAERLREEFLAACLRIDAEGEDLGEPGELLWHPDRTWDGRTYVPAEQVASIVAGQVQLDLDADAVKQLSDFDEPPPSEEILTPDPKR